MLVLGLANIQGKLQVWTDGSNIPAAEAIALLSTYKSIITPWPPFLLMLTWPLIVAADAVTVYARTLLQTPDWFLQFCEATGPQLAHLGSGVSSTTGEQLLLGFLDRWLDKFDAIGTPAARKLSALALCNVLTLPLPSLLQRLDSIAAHLTAVWFEVHPQPPFTANYLLCLD